MNGIKLDPVPVEGERKTGGKGDLEGAGASGSSEL
jgi:hypothetical protein